MKKLKYILLFISFSLSVFSQTNLVLNPSFEQYSSCPNNQGQATFANGWYEWGSADYFNACSSIIEFGVPNNWGGFQEASSGNAYCAIGTYRSRIYQPNNIREYLGTQLISPLNIGTKYFVSFRTSLSLDNTLEVNCASNNLGALFSDIPLNFTFPLSTSFAPKINHPLILQDTSSWSLVFDSFTADSSYEYIYIGNFRTDINTDTLIMNGSAICNAYYYIDDVCVSNDSLFAVGFSNKFTENKTYKIFPTLTYDFITISNYEPMEILVSIYNDIGKEVSSFNISSKSSEIISLEKFSSGIYVLTIKDFNSYKTTKIIKL